ncbi:hypothetical protein [Campylobacter majalis]|uniref:hypothetical protein n=1 Tax=Campylobacter majalis TaxID=2790656 RepID=UPI003D6843AD
MNTISTHSFDSILSKTIASKALKQSGGTSFGAYIMSMRLDKTMANEANKIIAASVHADTQMALSTPLQMNINQLKFYP